MSRTGLHWLVALLNKKHNIVVKYIPRLITCVPGYLVSLLHISLMKYLWSCVAQHSLIFILARWLLSFNFCHCGCCFAAASVFVCVLRRARARVCVCVCVYIYKIWQALRYWCMNSYFCVFPHLALGHTRTMTVIYTFSFHAICSHSAIDFSHQPMIQVRDWSILVSSHTFSLLSQPSDPSFFIWP